MDKVFNDMGNSREEYIKRKNQYDGIKQDLNKKINLVSLLRAVVFLGGIGGSVYLYVIHKYTYIPLVFLTSMLVFIILINYHEKLKESRNYAEALYNINENSIKRLEGEWKTFEDTGAEFMDEDHNYSIDLDIFGKGSLFQWINTSGTYLGRRRLGKILAEPCKSADRIKDVQRTVRELSGKLDWRQRFQAEGIISNSNAKQKQELHDPKMLFEWTNERNEFFRNPFIIFISRLLPAAAVLLLISAIALHGMPYYPSLMVICINIFLLLIRQGDMSRAFSVTDRYKDEIRLYERMLKAFEEENFEEGYLKDLKNSLLDEKKQKAYRQIKGLVKVVDMISMRYSELYLVLNIIALWDYQCEIALERWKEKSGRHVKKWLEVIGEFEALSSLSIIHYDNPEWAFPVISECLADYRAEELGHPLISKDRINNDLRVEKDGGVLLITGSNMSGKSTLLRTAGINLVLAYAGAPVCAKKFECSIMDIYTSMRVSDNLEKNISSFYAELIRIKTILQKAQSSRNIFFLLDEIFKGTNSRDRHTGARILIKSLSDKGAMGMVSTHDLELGDLAGEGSKKIKNYHFKEYYKEGQIFFDYKLRPGISTTRNAIYLMKMAGIGIDDMEMQ